jgi:hypothetical protein
MSTESDEMELAACTPKFVQRERFNPDAVLPFGCTVDNLSSAMTDFAVFLALINGQLHT